MFNLLVLLYFWKVNWKWKGVIFISLFAVRYFLYQAGVMHFKTGWWFLIITILYLLGGYFWVAVMDYLLRKNKAVNDSN